MCVIVSGNAQQTSSGLDGILFRAEYSCRIQVWSLRYVRKEGGQGSFCIVLYV